MKRYISRYLPFLLLFISYTQIHAQDYKRSLNLRQGYYTFGINGGIAYQQSDVCIDKPGLGIGLTLAKNLYYRPGALFSFDARGRFLYTQSYGLGDSRSYGLLYNEALNGSRELDYDFVYQNHRTDIAELGIEGVLTLNQLRERTGVIASIFGGVDLAWYYTRLDQQNAAGSYIGDYNSIDANAGSSQIRTQLRNSILDGVYETRAHSFDGGGKLGFMPAVGLELGYQFTPRFSAGLTHKATFARTDILDGQAWNDDNVETAENDIYHYTGLHLRWIIDPYKKDMLPPEITILYPQTNPHTTTKPDGTVRAQIKHVKQAFDVECSVNGYNSSFDYQNGKFNVNFPLEPGRNEIVITATNEAGTDTETVVIIGKDIATPPPPPVVDAPTGSAPRVNITNPSSNKTTSQSEYKIEAQTNHVKNKNEVNIFVNNATVSNFNFNERSKKITATVYLDEGKNTVKVRVRNRNGSDEDQVTITRKNDRPTQDIPTQSNPTQEPSVQKPSVNITTPNRDTHQTNTSQTNVKATVRNVNSKNNITITIDRQPIRDFTYNPSRGEVSFTVRVDEGRNQVDISARNAAGSASDRVIIVRETAQPQGNPPTVNITSVSDPSIDPLNPGKCTSTAIARITNVSNRNDIQFFINGNRSTQFSFNQSGTFQASFDLKSGRNDIRIKASNSYGTDQDDATVSCQSSSTTGTSNNQKPTVKITKPAVSSSTSSKNTALIEATVRNVSSKQDITFTVGNKRITDFSFNTSSGKVSKTISLSSGNNAVKIKANNKNGSAQDQASIRYMGSLGSSASTPKPEVRISKPSHNSTSSGSKADLEATVKNVSGKSQIQVKINGSSTSDFTYNNMTKKLSAKVSLRSGNNTILVKATNSKGSDDASVTVKYNPVQKPTVKITTPTNNSKHTKTSVTLKATIKNVTKKSGVQLYVNGKSQSFTFSNGNLSANITLKNGRNELKVKASNTAGSAEDKIAVTYEKAVAAPKPKPTVRYTQPTKSGSTVKKPAYTAKATVKHVTSKSGIKVIVNGKSLSNFTFSSKNGSLSIPLTLKSGKNNLKITATNASGKAEATTSITYQKTVVAPNIPKPEVTITSVSEPSIDPLNPGDARSSLFATVKNVSSKAQISVKVNGKDVAFNYNAQTKKVSATIKIEQGTNRIIVSARSKSGSDSDSKTVQL